MKAIDKLREEGRARGRGVKKKFFLSFPLLLIFFDSPLGIIFFLLAPILCQLQLSNRLHNKIQVLCRLKKV